MNRKSLHTLLLATLVIMLFTGCPKPALVDDIATLRDAGDYHGKWIGAAVDPSKFAESAYDTTLKTEFSMVVAENVMKMDTLQPNKDSFNFTPGDSIVAYATANTMALRGHALLWHSQLPTWIKSEPYANLPDLLLTHIDTVLTHYKGKMHSWDVVNEVVMDDGSGLRNNNEDIATSNYSIWADSATDDSLITEAFYKARTADPDAILIINDYSNETMGNAKADKLYSLVAGWINDGVPIDGVGFQLHLMEKYTPDYAAIRANINRYIALKPGFEVHFTEIDVRIEEPATEAKLANQAAIYSHLMDIALDYPEVTVYITWGVTDKYSWIPGFFTGYGSALIFDDLYEPKPAHDALLDMLQ